MNKIPPLSALRVFEAAARHMNFTQAADELCVTQAAVSHQIKSLEDWFGFPLFIRRGHQLVLTLEGKTYQKELADIFVRLAQTTHDLYDLHKKTVRITVLPSFASCWLLPRLGVFKARYGDISVHINSSIDIWSFDQDGFDLAIRSGQGGWKKVVSEWIANEALSPLCNPSFADYHRIEEAQDVFNCCRLYDTPKKNWLNWLRQYGLHDSKKGDRLVFDDHGQMLQAAMNGQGVAMGRLFLANDFIKAGRLMRLFDGSSIANDYAYWLVYPADRLKHEPTRLFREWLMEEAAKSRLE